MARMVTLGMLISVATSQAQSGSAAVHPADVNWEQDPETLLISYREIWGEFANQDPTPLIRIFGDGRVRVHYPVYTPKAGEYELWLQPMELEILLLSMVTKGLPTFEPKAVESLKIAEERRRWESALDAGKSPEVFMVADDSTSVFELHLSDYSAAGLAQPSGEVNRDISWLGLRTDAERYPDIEPIQQLRAAEIELRNLLEREDLWRVQ